MLIKRESGARLRRALCIGILCHCNKTRKELNSKAKSSPAFVSFTDSFKLGSIQETCELAYSAYMDSVFTSWWFGDVGAGTGCSGPVD